jgi:hypothetical protein
VNEQSSKSGAPTEEERARALREQLKGLRGVDLAFGMMVELVSYGYQKLGLTEATRELRDLGDARLAIELLRGNLEVLEREVGEAPLRDLRSTLAQMQLGYAAAVGTGDAPEERPHAAEAAPEAAPVVDEDARPAPTKAKARKPAAKKPAAKKPAAKKPRGGATPPAG